MPKTPYQKRNGKKSNFQVVLNNLKSNIMKVQSKDVSKDIDLSLTRISGTIIDKHATNYAEMMRNTFSDIIGQKFDWKHLSKDFFQSFVNAERFVRYANAEEIVDCIPYCARALKVIADEVVAPDEIDKSIIQIKQDDEEGEQSKKERNNIENINKMLEFEDHVHDLVYETMKLGDQFVEICDYTSADVPLTQVILTESDNIDENVMLTEPVEIGFSEDYMQENEGDDMEQKMTVQPVVVEASKPKVKKKSKEDDPEVDIGNVRLIFHDPRYVVKLQSQRFKMCLGYVILPRYQFSSSMGGDPRGSYLKSMLYGMDDYKDLTGIDKLYGQIMDVVKKHLGNKEFAVNKKEVMNMMARCVKEYEREKEMEFTVRYVAPDQMEHFVISNRRFFPYGEGIFYKTTFASKLLIALQSAATIKRISDSTDARVFYIETGVPRNARDVIEEVREARTKKKVSIDKFGSIASIPSMITSYEDYYIPQVNGKRFMEFDTLPPASNIRDLTEELKYFRDTLVASLEVPPAYIGLEENLSNKSALSFENILFARTIVAYQTVLSKHVENLFGKLHKFIYGTNFSPTVNITFYPPKMLQVERESEHLRMIADLINTLKDLGINEDFLKKKYLPIDWAAHDEAETTAKLDKHLEPKDDDEMGMGGMGGGATGF